jgi:predicted RNA binding protein YcfA (HicA-like mRNA interferase family)
MPSLSQLPGYVRRKKFIRALSSLGFDINTDGGDGSHYKATWPRTQKCVIIQADLRKDVLYYLLKEIENCSGITWDDIRAKL